MDERERRTVETDAEPRMVERHTTVVTTGERRGGGGTLLAVVLLIALLVVLFLLFGDRLTGGGAAKDLDVNVDVKAPDIDLPAVGNKS